jgi:hypothetical protein
MRLHKNSLSIFTDTTVKPGRPQTSPHGKLFGGDSLYEVLAELATHRGQRFSVLPMQDRAVIPLAMRIGRTPTQTRKEIRKLQNVGVLEQGERLRKTEVYAIAENEIADRVLGLPDLLVKRLGRYSAAKADAR